MVRPTDEEAADFVRGVAIPKGEAKVKYILRRIRSQWGLSERTAWRVWTGVKKAIWQ